jgi:proteasome lid subunit RPN8/RPN11
MSRSKAPRSKGTRPRAVSLTPHQLSAIVRHAETAYPEEACGLMIGRRGRSGVIGVSRVEPSPNLAPDNRRERFEVDPALRLRLERALRGSGEAIVGHYHSHPEHPARPSASDRARAYEPELIWLIVSVVNGEAVACGAHQYREATRRFATLDLRVPNDAPRRVARRPARKIKS